jgi:hypothetical protein
MNNLGEMSELAGEVPDALPARTLAGDLDIMNRAGNAPSFFAARDRALEKLRKIMDAVENTTYAEVERSR